VKSQNVVGVVGSEAGETVAHNTDSSVGGVVPRGCPANRGPAGVVE
jgi:hypothetical protein